MNLRIRILAGAAALLLAGSAWAQALVAGEVRKVDKAGGRITLNHGEIKPLDLPPMTMTYRVANPAMLDQVQVGDKVRFAAEKVGGNYTLTRLEK